MSGNGSSPLTRGKLEVRGACPSRCRLIPAHAGKTRSREDGLRHMWAHPRSRGENEQSLAHSPTPSGSSPLTRGKRRRRIHLGRQHRLIPAHAGKTPRRRSLIRHLPAHPRSRGENGSVLSFYAGGGGSSPLTRGKRLAGFAFGAQGRLIPAHAGKTPRVGMRARAFRAHPRSRGENLTRDDIVWLRAGSSPLTRGKLDECLDGGGDGRLIPAHAGKTRRRGSLRGPLGAHPRSRGENLVTLAAEAATAGSSPLTRGKPGCAPRTRRR